MKGACEGSVACSTCHVILPEEFYDRIEEPTDEENDMLDLAFGLTDTSVSLSHLTLFCFCLYYSLTDLARVRTDRGSAARSRWRRPSTASP